MAPRCKKILTVTTGLAADLASRARDLVPNKQLTCPKSAEPKWSKTTLPYFCQGDNKLT